MKNTKFVILTIFNLFLPIKKGTVFFRSFNGQYNDNPKYISEKLYRRNPNINIVWAVKDGEKNSFPNYVRLVNIDSAEYPKLISRAEVVVDNYVGCRTNFIAERNFLKRAVFRLISKRRKKQLNISTWHGTPLKHISLDEPKYKNVKFSKAYINTDILIAGCNITANAFKTAFNWKSPVLMCGTPRNDILFENKSEDIKRKLELPLNKKIILFAPTFRENDVELSGINQIKEFDLNRLFAKLSEKFGGEWCFVFRSHNLVMHEIKKSKNKLDKRIIDGNRFEDMAEYLSAADILLTDYSSSMFDFMLTKKAVFLYTSDLQNYKNNERGFYFEIKNIPFSIAETFEELLSNISDFNIDDYRIKTEAFLSKIENAETGNAAEKLTDIIERFIRN